MSHGDAVSVAHFINDHMVTIAKMRMGKCSPGSFADGRELTEQTR